MLLIAGKQVSNDICYCHMRERTPFSEAGLGVSGLGMFFSEGSPEQIELSPLELEPHFAFSQVIFSREWQWMAFAFTAQEAYTHFTWGVFGADCSA